VCQPRGGGRATPQGGGGKSRLCEREVEGQKNHCHYLRRGRAEEMAGAVQGHLQAEVAALQPIGQALLAPIQENVMRLCRYDDDRLGVVRGDMVHDVTEAQTQIRAAAPYAMKGDAVIAALPACRSRLAELAAGTPGRPLAQVKLLSPVTRTST